MVKKILYKEINNYIQKIITDMFVKKVVTKYQRLLNYISHKCYFH